MLQLLESGRALYVLTAACVLGILTRMITRRAYKRLLKESKDLSLTKNKSLKELRQRAENTYRVNQGLVDSGAWLEHQLYEFRTMGIRLSAWSGMSVRWTWLCLLLGGAAAMAGMGYLMKDKRTYQRLARKGKKMVVKAEEEIDDIMDDMMP